MLTEYNKNPYNKFSVGDLVLYYSGDDMVGNVKKLTSNWQGPYEITDIRPPGLVARIVDVSHPTSVLTVNVDKLKLWRSEDDALWIEAPLDYMFGIINGRSEKYRRTELMVMEHYLDRIKATQNERIKFHRETGRKVIQSGKIKANNNIINEITTLERVLEL